MSLRIVSDPTQDPIDLGDQRKQSSVRTVQCRDRRDRRGRLRGLTKVIQRSEDRRLARRVRKQVYATGEHVDRALDLDRGWLLWTVGQDRAYALMCCGQVGR